MPAIRTGADEARSPKYAHVERERRWLIDPSRLRASASHDRAYIEDRYITGTRMRLRRMTGTDGAVALKLTKKYDADDALARAIVTTYVTAAEFALLATLPALTLRKWRGALRGGGLTYSLDRFADQLSGLVLAEIEWPDDAGLRGLPPPPGAVRDVSGDPRYQGGALAADGIPEELPWPMS